MTPEVALQNLDKIAAVFQGNREQHLALIESVETLRKALPEPNNVAHMYSGSGGNGEAND